MHVSVVVTITVIFFPSSFSCFHSIISHRSGPSFLRCFPLCPFIMKRPPLPRLSSRPPSLRSSPSSWLSPKAELFCLSPSSRQPSPSLPCILIFSCSARCVFKVQRPPREPESRMGWNRKERASREEGEGEKERGRK